jgi:hypothetical protein
MNWEYKTLMFAGKAESWINANLGGRYYKDNGDDGFFTDPTLDKRLNAFAADGWELLSVLPFFAGAAYLDGSSAGVGSISYTFRRPAKATAQP